MGGIAAHFLFLGHDTTGFISRKLNIISFDNLALNLWLVDKIYPQMKSYFIFILLASLCFLHSCSSCTRTRDVACPDGQIVVLTVGFSLSDLSSALVVKYKQDNAFDSVVDSTRRVYNYVYRSDTLSFYAYTEGRTDSVHNIFFTGSYDYKIFLQNSGSTITITNVVQSGETHHVFSYSPAPVMDRAFICYNTILSCEVNGITFTGTDNTPSITVCATR